MARSLSFASAISATSPVLFDVGAEATADTDVDLCGEGSPPAPARPRTAAEELDDLVGGYLSLDKLEKETGCDPRLAKTIVLKVDTRLTSISSLGKQLPSLEQFKLNNSFVPSIRDLGSGYNALRILWMARCSLNDLSGLGSLANLRELYLANNNIFDTSPIGMLEYLEILDLEGNKIASDEMIEELAVCENLVELSLEGNPVCGGLSDDSTDRDSRKSFQEYVQSILPNICVLNDEILHTDGALLHKISALQAKRPMTSLDRPLSHAEEPASLMDDTSALERFRISKPGRLRRVHRRSGSTNPKEAAVTALRDSVPTFLPSIPLAKLVEVDQPLADGDSLLRPSPTPPCPTNNETAASASVVIRPARRINILRLSHRAPIPVATSLIQNDACITHIPAPPPAVGTAVFRRRDFVRQLKPLNTVQ